MGHTRQVCHITAPSGQIVNTELVQVIMTAGARHNLHQIGGRAGKIV